MTANIKVNNLIIVFGSFLSFSDTFHVKNES